MDLWEADCQLDRSELGEESLKIPQLHSKYYKLFSAERLLLRKLQQEYKQLYKLKHEYYNGTLDDDLLVANGWEPNALRILKSDIPVYMEGDAELQRVEARIEYQKEKVDFLENAIKSLNSRGFNIKNAIEWERFKVGA